MNTCSAHAEVAWRCWQKNNRYYNLYCDFIDVFIERWMLLGGAVLNVPLSSCFSLRMIKRCSFQCSMYGKYFTESYRRRNIRPHLNRNSGVHQVVSSPLGCYLSSVYIGSSSSSASLFIRMCHSVDLPQKVFGAVLCWWHVSVRVCFYFSLMCLWLLFCVNWYLKYGFILKWLLVI